jgi:hypothetical protein
VAGGGLKVPGLNDVHPVLYDVGQRPAQVAAQAASLDEHAVGPIADGEGFVAARAFLVAHAHFAALAARVRFGTAGGHGASIYRSDAPGQARYAAS